MDYELNRSKWHIIIEKQGERNHEFRSKGSYKGYSEGRLF